MMINKNLYQLLIVDDEIHAIRGIKESVDWEKLNISEVFTAYNIKQAKGILQNHKIDIIICDIEMPQGSGIDLLSWVKEYYPSILSVFLTCHEEFEYARKGIELDVLDYLVKPVPPEKIESTIRKSIKMIEKEQEVALLMQNFGSSSYYASGERSDSLVDKVKRYIVQNIDNDLSRESIANEFYISPDHLNRVFKKEAGITISEYLISQKMNRAKSLLVNTNKRISEIANMIGYNNFSHFSKQFKKITGVTPVEYRNSKQMMS